MTAPPQALATQQDVLAQLSVRAWHMIMRAMFKSGAHGRTIFMPTIPSTSSVSLRPLLVARLRPLLSSSWCASRLSEDERLGFGVCFVRMVTSFLSGLLFEDISPSKMHHNKSTAQFQDEYTLHGQKEGHKPMSVAPTDSRAKMLRSIFMCLKSFKYPASHTVALLSDEDY